jgi:hypothetical protein
MECWRIGRMEEWKSGRMEEWNGGRMEWWKDGIFTTEALRILRKKKLGMEGWNDRKLEELVGYC